MTRWRIGFMAAVEDSPWHVRRLRPGYSHVWAARCMWPGCWLWVEWTPERLIMGLVKTATVRAVSGRAHALIDWRGELGTLRRPRLPLLALSHCASTVGHALGLRVPLATPWRLARVLRASGGRVLRAGPELRS